MSPNIKYVAKKGDRWLCRYSVARNTWLTAWCIAGACTWSRIEDIPKTVFKKFEVYEIELIEKKRILM